MAVYHNARGSVNYTIVGSPTIVDGVVSGLDNGNLTIENFPFASSNWEIGIKVGFNYVQSTQRLLTSSGKFYLRTSYSTWQLITNGSTTTRIGDEGDANRYPFVKLVKNGSYISVYLSTDGITYKTGLENYSAGDATDGTLTISAQYFPWTGSVDLKHTYIIVNGQPWFGICPIEVKKHQIMGPVGYTVVGSPTIVDGVASGFSSSNSLRTSVTFPNDYTKNSYEFQVKIQTPSTIQASNIMGVFFRYAASDGFSYTGGGRLQWFFGGGTNILQTETNYIQPNSVYVIRGVYQRDTLSLYVGNSVDNLQLVASQEINDFTIETAQAAVLGVALNKASPFNGSIDLNETYIKVNGKLWFWQPQETKKIIVNGVEVYSKP